MGRCRATSFGVSLIMQLKCPSGHSRLKHGLHGRSSLSTCALSDSGGVNCGLLEPNIASIGLSSAAAMCINPESLLTTRLAHDTSAMASVRSVTPHRLRHGSLPKEMMMSATALSLDEPTSQTA